MNKQEKKIIRDLHHAKTRKPTGLCLVEGLRCVTTFLHSKHVLRTLYLTEQALTQAPDILKKCHYTVIPQSDMEQVSAATTPSGFLAIFEITQTSAPLGPGLVLAQLQDPGNVGTLIRTAVALTRKTVVFVESVDPWSPKVIQSSAGTIARANIHELSWHALKKQKNSIPLLALVTQHGQPPSAQDDAALFVVGNEAQGIPAPWIKECDGKITLPMPGNTESLNAAVAGSIALYMTLLSK